MVAFVLASTDRTRASGRQITDAPGQCDDVVTGDARTARTAGRQTFSRSKVRSDGPATFVDYLRTVITLKPGLTTTSTCRLPWGEPDGREPDL